MQFTKHATLLIATFSLSTRAAALNYSKLLAQQ